MRLTPEARDLLAFVADVASILGFLVTIAVALTVRRLRAFYMFKVRVPELTARIAEKASSISTRAADFNNTKDEIAVEFRQIGVLLMSLAQKASGAPKTAAKRLGKELKQTRISSRSDVTNIYAEIQTVLAQFDEVQRDREWER